MIPLISADCSKPLSECRRHNIGLRGWAHPTSSWSHLKELLPLEQPHRRPHREPIFGAFTVAMTKSRNARSRGSPPTAICSRIYLLQRSFHFSRQQSKHQQISNLRFFMNLDACCNTHIRVITRIAFRPTEGKLKGKGESK